MRKWLLTTINSSGIEEIRKVPAKNKREAVEKANAHDVVISCTPFQGKAANMYIKLCKEGMNK